MVMAGWRVRACEACLAVAVAAVCLFQVSFNWRRLQEGATWLRVVRGSSAAVTPPLTLCAFPQLDPRALLPLGLRLHTSNYSQARKDMESLTGVPADTPVRHVTEAGGWNVDLLVREVRVGNLREEYSPGVASPSLLWEEVLVQGPCLRLRPRPTHTPINISLRLQTKQQFLAGVGARASSPQAKMARRLLLRLFFVSVLLPGVSPTYMTTRTASPQPTWENHVMLESYSVRLVIRGDGPPAATCRASCYATVARSQGYCLMLPSPATVGNSCNTNMETDEVEECLKACRSDAFENKWRQVAATKGVNDDEFHVQLLEGHLWLWQEHAYPASKFLSDLGGSLGFFLGLSVSSLLMEARCMGTAWGWRGWRGRREQQQRRGASLYTLSVYLAASLLLVVHTLSLLRQVAAPPRTSVRLVRSGDADNPDNLSLHDALSVHLASRAFGCRLPSAAEPILQCLLENTTLVPLGAAPFTSLQDLPACSKIVLHEFPAIRYILPMQLMTLKQMEGTATLCQEKGVGQGTHQVVPTTPVTAYVTQEHSWGLRLLVDMGGIIGLYFGISVYVGVRHVLSSRWGRWLECGEQLAARRAAVVLVGVAAYTCYVHVNDYLSHPPVSVATTSQPLEGASPISLTLCPWPPVNITLLMAFAAAAVADDDVDDDVLSNHLQEEHPAAALLDAFMRNTSLLVAAWEAAKWHVQDLVQEYYDGEGYRAARGDDLTWQTVAWEGRRCFTNTATSYKQNSFVVMTLEKSGVRLQYTVHAAGEPPLLGEPFINELDALGQREKVLSALTTYRSLGQEDAPALGDCYHRCTHAAAMAEVGCVPPSAGDPLEGSATHLFCNSSAVRRLLLWALQNTTGELPQPLELFADHREACLSTCRRSPRTLLTLKVNGQDMTAPSITFHTNTFIALTKDYNLDARTLLTEYDAYPPSNLLSDAGSLMGLLLGVSVMSVGKWLLSRLKKTPSPQDTEAQGTQ